MIATSVLALQLAPTSLNAVRLNVVKLVYLYPPLVVVLMPPPGNVKDGDPVMYSATVASTNTGVPNDTEGISVHRMVNELPDASPLKLALGLKRTSSWSEGFSVMPNSTVCA